LDRMEARKAEIHLKSAFSGGDLDEEDIQFN
jgi:hypothetical protein